MSNLEHVESPSSRAVPGWSGAIIGGVGGYWIGPELGETGYEWARNTLFERLPVGDLRNFLMNEGATP